MYSTRIASSSNWNKSKIVTYSIISSTILLYNPCKNSFFIDYFVKKISLKSADHKIVTLPPDLHQFADDVRNQIRIKEKSRALVKFFFTKELDITPVGNLNLLAGARIGIPYTFTYDRIEDVDPNVISSLIGVEKFIKSDWHRTEKGQKLIESLVLSKEARKFAIARGIMAADSESIMYEDLFRLFSLFLTFAVYEFLKPPTTHLMGKFPSFIVLGTMITVASITFLSVGFDLIDQTFAKLDDTRVLRHPNQDYKKGGPEFYEKLIARNKSLRGLLTDGPERFDSDGNPISWSPINFSSLKSRLDNCKNVIDTWTNDTSTL